MPSGAGPGATCPPRGRECSLGVNGQAGPRLEARVLPSRSCFGLRQAWFRVRLQHALAADNGQVAFLF